MFLSFSLVNAELSPEGYRLLEIGGGGGERERERRREEKVCARRLGERKQKRLGGGVGVGGVNCLL